VRFTIRDAVDFETQACRATSKSVAARFTVNLSSGNAFRRPVQRGFVWRTESVYPI